MKKISQLNKFYYPQQGGIESCVNQITLKLLNRGNAKILNITTAPMEPKKISSEKIIWKRPFFSVFNIPLSLNFSKSLHAISESDIVIYHHPNPGFLIELLFVFFSKKSFIIFWHCNSSKFPFWDWIILLLIKVRTDKKTFLVFSSNNYRKLVRKKYKFKIENSYIQPLSHEIEKQNLDFSLTKEIIFVGRLVKYKNLYAAIDLMRHLPEYKFRIVGSGPEESKLKNYSRNLDNIEFINNASDEEKIRLLSKSDIFILPSNSEAEAFGVSQLEAAACGNIIIRNNKLKTGVSEVFLGMPFIFDLSSNAKELAHKIRTHDNLELLKSQAHQEGKKFFYMENLQKILELISYEN